MSSKPYVCLPCGKHYGGLLLHITDLTQRSCRVCRGKLNQGWTAFHCKDNSKTVWIKPDGGVSEDWKGTIVIINLEQYEKLTGKKQGTTP
jgi:DNA-directed RNA polymerase subunit RPC12/RpoP